MAMPAVSCKAAERFNMEFEKGMLAISRAGHDTGKVYVIADADEAYVYLVDGAGRSLANPKKKKKKHVQLIKEKNDITKADDGRIKEIVNKWRKEHVKG